MNKGLFIIIAILGVFICDLGFTVNNDYSKNAGEDTHLHDQDESAFVENAHISVDFKKTGLICFNRQMLKESFVKHFFHPPR